MTNTTEPVTLRPGSTSAGADPAPRTARRRTWRWLGRLAGILFGLLLAWLLLEIALRVAFDGLPAGMRGTIQNVRRVPWDSEPIAPQPPFIPDGTFQSIMPPNLNGTTMHFSDGTFPVSTIALWDERVGFRSREPEWPVDVVVVGDSFSFCFTNFDDCYVERLRRDYGWHTVNLGQVATGSLAHREMLAAFGVHLQPQAVIWQWYGNDFNDDYGLGLLRGEYEPLDEPDGPPPPRDLGRLADYSAVYAVLRDQLYTLTDGPVEGAGEHVEVGEHRLLVADGYKHGAFDLDRPANARGWEMSAAALREAHDLVQPTDDWAGAALVIVLVPTKEEVYAEYLGDAVSAEYLSIMREGRLRMRTLCAEMSWHCIDPIDRLRAEAARGELVYYELDLHLNAYGNEVLAEEIARYLAAHELLEPARDLPAVR